MISEQTHKYGTLNIYQWLQGTVFAMKSTENFELMDNSLMPVMGLICIQSLE